MDKEKEGLQALKGSFCILRNISQEGKAGGKKGERFQGRGGGKKIRGNRGKKKGSGGLSVLRKRAVHLLVAWGRKGV